MLRTFQDSNLLVWEAYASGGRHGFSDDVNIIFHCVTDRALRPRFLATDDDAADAQRTIAEASPAELLGMLERARDIA